MKILCKAAQSSWIIISLLLGMFIILSSIFVLVYAYTDYKHYHRKYKKLHHQEKIQLANKERQLFETVDSLLQLAAKRIVALKATPKVIQNVLISTDRLRINITLPSFSKLTYKSFITPQKMVTRFNITSITEADRIIAHPKDDTVLASGSIHIHKLVKSSLMHRQGILTAVITESSLRDVLGTFQTLHYALSSVSRAPKSVLRIQKINHDRFLKYTWQQKAIYLIFLLYMSI